MLRLEFAVPTCIGNYMMKLIETLEMFLMNSGAVQNIGYSFLVEILSEEWCEDLNTKLFIN